MSKVLLTAVGHISILCFSKAKPNVNKIEMSSTVTLQHTRGKGKLSRALPLEPANNVLQIVSVVLVSNLADDVRHEIRHVSIQPNANLV